MRKMNRTLILSVTSIITGISIILACNFKPTTTINAEVVVAEPVSVILMDHIDSSIETMLINNLQMIYDEINTLEIISEKDIELIALVTMAEAEGECEEGKRLVIDTILNRLDSEHFPDTIYDVIYQKSQFSSMWDGRVERCEVQQENCKLVKEELESRMSDEVMFFTAGRYSNYGEPMYQVENHYFSSYN